MSSLNRARAKRAGGQNDVRDIGANCADIVIDRVAGSQWPALLDVLRPGGRYAVSGAIAGPVVALDMRTLYLADFRFFGCNVLELDVFAGLVKRIEPQEIVPLIAQTYSLTDIATAQRIFGDKGRTGKIIREIS